MQNEFGINHGPSENEYQGSGSIGKDTEQVDRDIKEKLMANRKEERYQLALKVAKWEEKQAKFRKRQDKIKRNRIQKLKQEQLGTKLLDCLRCRCCASGNEK